MPSSEEFKSGSEYPEEWKKYEHPDVSLGTEEEIQRHRDLHVLLVGKFSQLLSNDLEKLSRLNPARVVMFRPSPELRKKDEFEEISVAELKDKLSLYQKELRTTGDLSFNRYEWKEEVQ